MLFSLDGTFVVQLINFAIFFGLVTVLFIKPVGAAIAERRRYIDSVMADFDEYQRRLAAARAAIAKDVEAVNAEYAGRVARIIEEAQATVQREMAQARSAEDRLVRELAAEMLARTFAAGGVR